MYAPVSQSTSDIRIVPSPGGNDVLTESCRQGAREMVARAIEAEVADWINPHAHLKDEHGRRRLFERSGEAGFAFGHSL